MRRIFLLGTVSDNKDPKKLGRIQVELKGFPESIKTPFLRTVVPFSTDKSGKEGWVFVPEKGDEVVLLSPSYGADLSPDDLAGLLVLGCVYNGKDRKPGAAGGGDKNDDKLFTTKSGIGLTFDDKTPSIVLHGAKKSPDITIDSKKKTIVIHSKGSTITIGEKKIEIKTGADGLTLKTSGDLKIDAGGKVSIKGKGVDVNAGGAACNIKGSAVNLC